MIRLSNTKTHGVCVVVSILLAYVSATDDQSSARITSYHIPFCVDQCVWRVGVQVHTPKCMCVDTGMHNVVI